jgi:hypothetical protein
VQTREYREDPRHPDSWVRVGFKASYREVGESPRWFAGVFGNSGRVSAETGVLVDFEVGRCG